MVLDDIELPEKQNQIPKYVWCSLLIFLFFDNGKAKNAELFLVV